MSGHLFVINGDLTKLSCDAILIPTDNRFSLTKRWTSVVAPHSFQKTWPNSGLLRINGERQGPDVWLGNIGVAGDSSGPEWFTAAARRFVSTALAELRGRRTSSWPKPRLAINVLGSGH